jgi:hypothetical protein
VAPRFGYSRIAMYLTLFGGLRLSLLFFGKLALALNPIACGHCEFYVIKPRRLIIGPIFAGNILYLDRRSIPGSIPWPRNVAPRFGYSRIAM